MTPYGAGKLLYVRKDGFLNVKFPWGLGCIRHECVKPFAEKNSSKLVPTTPSRKRKRASSAPKTKSHKKRKTTKNKGKEKQVDKIKEKKKKVTFISFVNCFSCAIANIFSRRVS